MALASDLQQQRIDAAVPIPGDDVRGESGVFICRPRLTPRRKLAAGEGLNDLVGNLLAKFGLARHSLLLGTSDENDEQGAGVGRHLAKQVMALQVWIYMKAGAARKRTLSKLNLDELQAMGGIDLPQEELRDWQTDDVLAYFSGRREREILIDPEYVRQQKVVSL